MLMASEVIKRRSTFPTATKAAAKATCSEESNPSTSGSESTITAKVTALNQKVLDFQMDFT